MKRIDYFWPRVLLQTCTSAWLLYWTVAVLTNPHPTEQHQQVTDYLFCAFLFSVGVVFATMIWNVIAVTRKASKQMTTTREQQS